jgi:hypothetical protein
MPGPQPSTSTRAHVGTTLGCHGRLRDAGPTQIERSARARVGTTLAYSRDAAAVSRRAHGCIFGRSPRRRHGRPATVDLDLRPRAYSIRLLLTEPCHPCRAVNRRRLTGGRAIPARPTSVDLNSRRRGHNTRLLTEPRCPVHSRRPRLAPTWAQHSAVTGGRVIPGPQSSISTRPSRGHRPSAAHRRPRHGRPAVVDPTRAHVGTACGSSPEAPCLAQTVVDNSSHPRGRRGATFAIRGSHRSRSTHAHVGTTLGWPTKVAR